MRPSPVKIAREFAAAKFFFVTMREPILQLS